METGSPRTRTKRGSSSAAKRNGLRDLSSGEGSFLSNHRKIEMMVNSRNTTLSRIFIPAMDCPDEEKEIRAALGRLGGIEALTFHLFSRQLEVRHRGELEEILAALRTIGMEGHPVDESLRKADIPEAPKAPLTTFYLSASLFLAGTLLAFFLPVSPWAGRFFLAAVLAGGAPIAVRGARELRNRSLGMNAVIREGGVGGRERTVAAEEVRPGDLLILRPGERVPVDAVVYKGSSDLNEAMLTGESIPVEKREGDPLYAGTVHGRSLLLAAAILALPRARPARHRMPVRDRPGGPRRHRRRAHARHPRRNPGQGGAPPGGARQGPRGGLRQDGDAHPREAEDHPRPGDGGDFGGRGCAAGGRRGSRLRPPGRRGDPARGPAKGGCACGQGDAGAHAGSSRGARRFGGGRRETGIRRQPPALRGDRDRAVRTGRPPFFRPEGDVPPGFDRGGIALRSGRSRDGG